MRIVGPEMRSTLTVLAVCLAIACVFPYGAIGFRPRSDAERVSPSAAFVSLTDEQQGAAMLAARTSWQVNAGGVRQLRTDLSVGELPGNDLNRAVDIGVRPSRSALKPVECPKAAYPSGLAAPPAGRIAPQKINETSSPVFSKSELLKIE